jgi:hypothetical protein
MKIVEIKPNLNMSRLWSGSGSRSESNETIQIICKWTCKKVSDAANILPINSVCEIIVDVNH